MTVSVLRMRLGWNLNRGAVGLFSQNGLTSSVRCTRSLVSVSSGLSQRLNTVGSFSYQLRQFSKIPRPILYQAAISPPSRTVRLAAEALGLDIEIRDINLSAGEHHTKEFTKINPENTLPTLDDDGFYLSDSHAIICYLVDKYGKDDSLYPKDLRSRALINQRLHFESGVLFARLRFITFPLFTRKTDTVTRDKLDSLDLGYADLDKVLEGKQWLVGDSYTLADMSCVTTISSIQCVQPIDKYSNIKAWLKRCEDNLPGYAAINIPGVKIFHAAMSQLIKSKQ